jgi:hypothetical protein
LIGLSAAALDSAAHIQNRLEDPGRFRRMRKLAFFAAALLLIESPSLLFAQKRMEVGIFLDYLNVSQTSTNNFGVGGRFGYGVHRDAMMV